MLNSLHGVRATASIAYLSVCDLHFTAMVLPSLMKELLH